MKRFADSLSRQKGIKPPPGYKTSISICRKFLSEHASKIADGETAGKLDPKPVSPAQLLYAKKIAQGKGIIIPDDAKTNSAAMSAWIDSNRGKTRPQAWSQDRLPVDEVSCTSIDRASEEYPKAQG
jgi:DNA topoisomerase III